MKTILETLFLPCISSLNMTIETKDHYKDCGVTYTCPDENSNNFFWSFYVDDLFAICVYDIVSTECTEIDYIHPCFYSIGLYNIPVANCILKKKQSPSILPQIISYSRSKGNFRGAFPKGIHTYSMNVTFSNQYMEQLSSHFHISKDDFIQTCFAPYSNLLIPEAEFILKQIFAANPMPAFAHIYYEGKILELLSFLLQWNERSKIRNGYKRLSDEDLNALKQIETYMQIHYGEIITIDYLEKMVFIGRNKLSQIFKAYFGMSIMEYLCHIRMEHAKILLLETRQPISDIAHACGYRNQGSFSEKFKHLNHISPIKYRKIST